MDIDERRRLLLRVHAEQVRAKPIRVNNLARLVQVKHRAAGYTTHLLLSTYPSGLLSLPSPRFFFLFVIFYGICCFFDCDCFFFLLSLVLPCSSTIEIERGGTKKKDFAGVNP